MFSIFPWLDETSGKLEDSLGGTGESVTLLPEEDVVVLPVARNAEAFVKTTVFVGFSEQPRRVDKVLA